jgi:phenylacetic acid degradation operon negative regulatory protein
VPEPRRDLRHPLRTRLAWAGFGSLGRGLWISPHAEREAEPEGMATEDSAAELLSFRTELGTVGDPQRLVAEAWDLTEVVAAYDAFITDFGRLRPKTPEAVFRAQTPLVHAWRRFPFLDPDLPEALLPNGSKARPRRLPGAARRVGARPRRTTSSRSKAFSRAAA